jgi:Fic family protein
MREKTAYRWHPLQDYQVPPTSLARPELRQLAQVWAEQRNELDRVDGLEEFNLRLKREWAIETGLVERVYTLDRGITQILIERGIDASLIPHDHGAQDPQRVAAMIRDHEAAIDGLFDFIRGERRLSTSYVRELHALLTRNQETTAAMDTLGHAVEIPLLRGEYKRHPNNPTRPNGAIHEYCPPEQAVSEMDRLIELHQSHREVPPEVEAAWLHHRFTQIHPFQDGNGRVARALATLILLKAGWFPFTIRDVESDRIAYLDALEAADRDDLGPLVGVCTATQKRAFAQALGISAQLLRSARVEQVIRAAKNDLANQQRARREQWEVAKETAVALVDMAKARFAEVAATLDHETSQLLPNAEFWTDGEVHGGPQDHFFRWPVIEVAKSLGYDANTRVFHSWARLVIAADSRGEILVSFHGVGHEYRGVLAASACFFHREETADGDRQIVDLTPLSSELFQVNYMETKADATARFQSWLEEVLVNGLELWRATL